MRIVSIFCVYLQTVLHICILTGFFLCVCVHILRVSAACITSVYCILTGGEVDLKKKSKKKYRLYYMCILTGGDLDFKKLCSIATHTYKCTLAGGGIDRYTIE